MNNVALVGFRYGSHKLALGRVGRCSTGEDERRPATALSSVVDTKILTDQNVAGRVPLNTGWLAFTL
jgi:hypothetical protein